MRRLTEDGINRFASIDNRNRIGLDGGICYKQGKLFGARFDSLEEMTELHIIQKE